MSNEQYLKESFDAACQSAFNSPTSDDAWDHVEEFAERHGYEEAVGQAYRRAVEHGFEAEVFDYVARRAVAFHDEWCGDSPEEMQGLLERIVAFRDIDRWAFNRLTALLSGAGNWTALFDVYDRALNGQIDDGTRRELLEEAADIARDLADMPEKSLDYLLALQTIDRQNTSRLAVIRGLLEKAEQWDALIDLLMAQIPFMDGDAALETRLEIADCLYVRKDDPGRALIELEGILSDHAAYEPACEQVKRILCDDTRSEKIRYRALDLLLLNYQQVENHEAVVDALHIAVAFADEADKLNLYRKMGAALGIQNKHEEAIQAYSALLQIDPADADALRHLRVLAAKSKRFDLRAEALMDAARHCDDDLIRVTHLCDAAALYVDELDRVQDAVAIYNRLLEQSGLDGATVQRVAYSLNELLSRTGEDEKRLPVLEMIAENESTTIVRRTVLQEAARLAAKLDLPDRAIGYWQKIHELDETDLDVLGAIISLLEVTEQWDVLIQFLNKRAAGPIHEELRRCDLVSVARIYEDKLDDVDAAITIWQRVFSEFGSREDVLSALDALLSARGRFEELSAMLETATAGEFVRIQQIFIRLAHITLEEVADTKAALRYYKTALSLAPDNQEAREGVRRICEVPDFKAEAVRVLVSACDATRDWEALVALLDERLDVSQDEFETVGILKHTAAVYQHQLFQPDAAFSLYCRLLPMDPSDQDAYAKVSTLGRELGCLDKTAACLLEAGRACEEGSATQLFLFRTAAALYDTELDDSAQALSIHADIQKHNPFDTDNNDAIVVLACKTGELARGVLAFVLQVQNTGSIDDDMIRMLESAAISNSLQDVFARSMQQGLAQNSNVPPGTMCALQLRVSRWLEQQIDDEMGAAAAAAAAVSAVPDSYDARMRWAEFQSKQPNKEYVDNLKQIYALKKDDIDPLLTAAQTAINALDDYEQQRTCVVSLYEEAVRQWRLGVVLTGRLTAAECALQAITQIAQLDLENGQQERAARILLDGARLPFDDNRSYFMRNKSASLFEAEGLSTVAIDVYNEILARHPADQKVLGHLERLLDQEDRILELLSVKQQRLELTEDQQIAMALRLDISRLSERLEGRDARLKLLKRNLEVVPGHTETIAAVRTLLENRLLHEDLARLLEEQAAQLMEGGQRDEAVPLLTEAAQLYSTHIKAPDKAIAAFLQVADIELTSSVADSLSKLYMGQNDLLQAGVWLEKKLSLCAPEERISTMLRLAKVKLKTDAHQEVKEILERGFEMAPQNAEIRRLLIELYRDTDAWDGLVTVLEASFEHVKDGRVLLGYAREAADVYFERLRDSKRAEMVLRLILDKEPDDSVAKRRLADTLIEKERYDEAGELLGEILKDFGRRRSPQRAAIHARLATVLRAGGDKDGALAHLDQAWKMDGNNIDTAMTLAQLAKEKDDLDLAERTYRTLLMTVRRDQGNQQESGVGPARILLELSWIAASKGQTDKQMELQQSALDTLDGNDRQAEALQDLLLESERYNLLEQVYLKRLDCTKGKKRRSSILNDLASLYEGVLDDRDKAFEIRLEALKTDAGHPENHDCIRRLATQLDRYEEYVDLINGLLKTTRRDKDVLTRCELLLRYVDVNIAQGGDLGAAIEAFEEAEAMGVREVDVLRCGARLAAARGDKDEEIRLLTALSGLGESASNEDTQVDALFRLAEINLGSAETIQEGIVQLTEAFDNSGNSKRAGRIIRRVGTTVFEDERMLHLYERIARKSEDAELMLDYFLQASNCPSITPATLQEGAQLALSMDKMETAETILTRMIAAQEVYPECGDAICWAELALGNIRQDEEDWAAAVTCFMDASDISPDETVFEFGIDLANSIRSKTRDLVLASHVYQRLLETHPDARAAWAPLADVYAELGDVEGFECLVEDTLYSLENIDDRNTLRLKWVRLLFGEAGRESDAVDTLKNVLLDNPGHREALEMLSRYYIDTGKEDELMELLQDRYEDAWNRRAGDEVRGLALELGRLYNDNETKKALYRRSLEAIPDDRELLLALIDSLDPQEEGAERVALLERTLVSEEGEGIEQLTLKVADAYRAMGDGEGVTRTLKAGYERLSESENIKAALEADFKETGDYLGLVSFMETNAAALDDERTRLMIWGEIADLCRDHLDDPHRELAALSHMEDALKTNDEFRMRVIAANRRLGNYQVAQRDAEALLESVSSSADRLQVLRLLAGICGEQGQMSAAAAFLDEAWVISDDEEIAAELATALTRWRDAAAAESDVAGEKMAVMKLAALFEKTDQGDGLHDLLKSWLEVHSEDVDAWRLLCTHETSLANWPEVIEACKKLTVLTEGDEQLDVGQLLTKACRKTNEMEIARRGLEYIFKENIDGSRVKDLLKEVYAALGAWHELATLLAIDAKACEDTTDKAALFRKAGEAYLKAEDPETALLALNESLALDPDNAESSVLVIDVAIETGDLDTAESRVDAALDGQSKKRTPLVAALQYRKSRISKARGDRAEQLSWLEAASTTSRADGHILAELADLAEELDEWDIASKALRNISLLKGDCPISKAESFFRQGRIAHAQGDAKKALLYVKKAIQENRDYAEAQAFLEQIESSATS